MGYSTDAFLEFIYDKYRAKPLSMCISADELREECASRRKRLRTILAMDKLEALGYEIKTERVSEAEYRIEALPEFAFPVWVLELSVPNGKTVLYLPGHDAYGARGSFSDRGQDKPFHHWLPLRLKESGYTVVVPELIGFGELVKEKFSEEHRGCYANTELTQLMGLNIEGIRAYQAFCAVRAARDAMGLNVNFLYGISGGGLIAALVSALGGDFEAVVISNYGASFRTSIMPMRHCADNYIPSILEIGESADVIALGAPKPLLLTNGKADRIFPCGGVKETAEELAKVYRLLGAEGNFRSSLHSGGHEADVEGTIGFFNGFLG